MGQREVLTDIRVDRWMKSFRYKTLVGRTVYN